MTASKYGFYFERAGLGATQGAIAPAEQFFEGTTAEEALAREFGQNSLDAADGTGEVVRMTFELREMATDEIPGIEGLREHLDHVVTATRGSQGHNRMLTARDTAAAATIQVLRVSDRGTKGLQGSESIRANTSALSALTRGAGVSANDGTRGGSFGIGSAVGPMSSHLSTVLYTSLPLGDAEVVFAGHARLATHLDGEGVLRMGDGFFTDLTCSDDFRYLRNPGKIGPFSRREHVGTDVYVLGYRKAGIDPDLHHIRDAFIEHFMAAIHRGRLVVEGVSETGSWQLDAGTLAEQIGDNKTAQAFYTAIQDPNPIEADHPVLGRLQLRINIDDSLPKTLNTITMRAPLMKIDTFKHTSIPVRYAAVLECSSPEGNKLLRDLEPPQHDRWDGGRADGGAALVKDLKAWVRQGIRSRVADEVGESVEVKGLARFLPTEGLNVQTKSGLGGVPGLGDPSLTESSTVRGRSGRTEVTGRKPRKSVQIGVKVQGGSPGDDEASTGKQGGGESERASKGGDLAGKGSVGEGSARIAKGDVRFRSWSQAGGTFVSVTSDVDLTGDLELLAVGLGGSGESDYSLPISNAHEVTASGDEQVKWNGNTLKNLQLRAGETVRIRLEMANGSRYRLDVKA